MWEFLKDNSKTLGLLGAGLGGLFAAKDGGGNTSGSQGYSGGIPDYTYNRRLKDNAFSNINPDGSVRRPGSAGRSYFDYPTGSEYAELTTEAPISTGVATYNPELSPINPFFQRQEMFTNPEDATKPLTAGRILGADTLRIAEAEEAKRIAEQEAAGTELLTSLSNANTLATAAATPAGTAAATPAATPAVTPPAGTGTGAGAGAGTAAVTSPATLDETTVDTFSVYDDILENYINTGSYREGEPQKIIDLITGGNKNIGNIAQDFSVPEVDIYDVLLRQQEYTPAELAQYIATNAADQTEFGDYSEVDLIMRLLEEGKTSAEEVLAYYQNTDPAQFGDTTLEEVKEYFKQAGGTRELAQGGMLNGTTDGMADQIPATIGGTQPARLSDGEFVVPADVVSHLGNGNTDAGATQLYSMMDRVRKQRTGTTKQGAEINPTQSLPA
tara:strand:+ start:413 stop:1741 length:1329 start_codon:yes stop_codon:yes gene_type:complete